MLRFPIPHDIDFLPTMTEKPIPRSNVMLTDGQGNQLGRTNWQLAGFSSGCEQDVSNYSGVAQHADQDQLVRNGGDNIRNADIGHEVTRMGNNTGNHIVSQTPGLNSSLLASILAYPNIAHLPLQLHHLVQAHAWYGSLHFPTCMLKSMLRHDLNSSPRIEADAASSVTTSFKSAAVVPDQAKRLESKLTATSPSQERNSSGESEKNDLVIIKELKTNQHNSDELSCNIADSSSAVISTPFEGEKDLARLDEQGIDLNKTPQKQPPKRRKHRPKVIVEDKPKRTPKVATTKNTDPKEKSTEKRKYIRKDLKEPAIQQTDSAIGTTPPSSAKRKYVRKKAWMNQQLNIQILLEKP
ncbi:transcriptional activator DEMETER [Salix suchowensis]|nr:transcriptional activator DEMETER [Salix suchowensis]